MSSHNAIGKFQKGVTLIELMVAVAIVGILAAIAVPIYQDYIDTSKRSALIENMETIRLFQEERRLDRGAYMAGIYDPATPNAAGGLTELIGWAPRTDIDEVTYVVSNVTASGFQIKATHSDGTEEIKVF